MNDRKLWIVGIFVILTILVIAYVGGVKAARNIIRIHNKASQRITHLETYISGSHQTHAGIDLGLTFFTTFEVTRDTSFRIIARFANGDILDHEFGYVGASSSSGNLVEITVYDHSIKGVQLR